MLLTTRLIEEQRHHDQQARERADYFNEHHVDLRFEDEAYLDHESWIRPAISLLGELRGKTVLDYGCGHGMASVVFARRGATVTGFDLSFEYVREAERRAEANQVAATFLQADAEQLPFENNTFDAVWGSAILHHLDLEVAGRELFRILKPNGIAVFCEPWGENPLLNLAREHLPYPGKSRTPDEHPLRREDLAPLETIFGSVTIHGYQLMGMLNRAFRRERHGSNWLDVIDQRLLMRFPSLKRWCRYAVIAVRKPR
jgi:SAM-dependent methyltransferase